MYFLFSGMSLEGKRLFCSSDFLNFLTFFLKKQPLVVQSHAEKVWRTNYAVGCIQGKCGTTMSCEKSLQKSRICHFPSGLFSSCFNLTYGN